MKEEELRSLIEKYYNGKSTEDQEKALREYFSQNDIPGVYEAEKEIFGYYMLSRDIPEPSADFESRILAAIDSREEKKELTRKWRSILPYLSVAAGLLILAGSYFFFINKNKSEDTYNDPRIAYAETMKILYSLSTKLNHGPEALEPVGKINAMTAKSFKAITESSARIGKELKSLSYLNRAIEIADVSDQTNKPK